MNDQSKIPGICLTAFWIGLSSLILTPFFLILSWFFPNTGAMSPLLGLILPLALSALILGIVAMKGEIRGSRGRRFALLGLVFGSVTLGLMLLLIVFVMLLFLPMLGM